MKTTSKDKEENDWKQDKEGKWNKSTSQWFVSLKIATRRWLLHYAFTCHRLTHVSSPPDRSSGSHIADMWLEAVGCLVGTEAAGGTPPSRLRLISAARTHTHADPLKDPAAPTDMNPGPAGRTGWGVLILSTKDGPHCTSGGHCRWRLKWGRICVVFLVSFV